MSHLTAHLSMAHLTAHLGTVKKIICMPCRRERLAGEGGRDEARRSLADRLFSPSPRARVDGSRRIPQAQLGE
ncbi:hypothetical protein N9L68_07380 [bacterium]|nr:hypothetical protein [bacterium]